MFTPPGYRKRLLADLERWAETGGISRAAADAIAAEYRTDSSHAILTVLAFVLAILAAAGVVALVAANWNAIPREVRLVGLLSLNLVALGACLAFRLARKPGSIAIECAAALSVMSAAATISLVGQMYHLPSNWPGFGLAMMCVAGATALVARSTACLWLAAAALFTYHVANADERRILPFDVHAVAPPWTADEWIFFIFSIGLIAVAVSRWTVRSGPWTIFIAVLPLFWWTDSPDLAPTVVGHSLAWTACGIAAASILARELGDGGRFDAAASALIGVFAIGAAAQVTQMPAWGLLRKTDVPDWLALLAIAAAAALAITAAARRWAERASLWWLAAALAVPFVVAPFLSARTDEASPLDGIIRLALVIVLPLGLLAVEARLSERRKTFAFAITAMIVAVCAEVWWTKDLVSLAWVLLGGSVLLGAAILLTRALARRPPDAAREGAA